MHSCILDSDLTSVFLVSPFCMQNFAAFSIQSLEFSFLSPFCLQNILCFLHSACKICLCFLQFACRISFQWCFCLLDLCYNFYRACFISVFSQMRLLYCVVAISQHLFSSPIFFVNYDRELCGFSECIFPALPS